MSEACSDISLSLDEFEHRVTEIGFPEEKINHLVQLLLHRPHLSINGIIDLPKIFDPATAMLQQLPFIQSETLLGHLPPNSSLLKS